MEEKCIDSDIEGGNDWLKTNGKEGWMNGERIYLIYTHENIYVQPRVGVLIFLLFYLIIHLLSPPKI